MIPNCKTVYYDTEFSSIYLEFMDGTSCPFYSISDGFRCMVAMVTDMVRRIGLLNPHLGMNALKETEGVVLVDELDLYLHPKWQRRVVGDLKTLFPKLQFIVTTHSPFIIQSLSPGEVIDLAECHGEVIDQPLFPDNPKVRENSAWPGPGQPYANRSLEDIVEDVMDIPIPQRSRRYQEMFDAAQEYYRILKGEKAATPEEKERKKRRLDECSAPFSENVAYHAFLEMEREAEMSEKGGANEAD